MRYIVFLFVTIFLFTACSNKKYFEPEDVDENFSATKRELPSDIVSMNRIGATLEDGEIITRQGVSKFKLPEGFDFLNVSFEGKVLATNHKDKLLIGNDEKEVQNPVIAASLKDDKLALVYSNNSIELIDISIDKTLYKEYLPLSLANDTRMANPHFMGNLILFPTLSGKVVILSLKTFESVKNIAVDPDGEFNNIIYLKVIKSNQTLIVASPNKVVSISTKNILAKDYQLRDILVDDENVYIATIDGQIIKLDSNLDVIAKKKFKYAKVYTLAISEDNLYALESQGFLIVIPKDFTKDTIYKFNFDNEKKVMSLDNKIFYDSKELELP